MKSFLLFSLISISPSLKVENWVVDSWAIDESDENFPATVCEDNEGGYEWISCEIGSFFSSELLRKKVHFFRKPSIQKVILEADIDTEFLEKIKLGLIARDSKTGFVSKQADSISCSTDDASNQPLLKAFIYVPNRESNEKQSESKTFHEVDLFFHRDGEKYNFQYRARTVCSPSALENGCSQVKLIDISVKWGASSRRSFRPSSAWGSIDRNTLGKTRPTFISSLPEKEYLTTYLFSAVQKKSSSNCTFVNFSRSGKLSRSL